MTFLVHACEGIYQGLHGMEKIEIIEAMDLNEIHEIATEMSIELMGSYSCITDELEEEIEDIINSRDATEWNDYRIDELRNEIYNDNVYYDLYELDNEKIKGYSSEQLEEEAYNDIEEFLSKYQKED